MREDGIVDVWREMNPTSRDYSHYSFAHNIYSRIDYFFMLKGDFFRVVNCEIGPSSISDHGPIYMSVHLNNQRKSTLWRLNSNILNKQNIKVNLKSEIKMYLENNDNEDVTPPIVWDALKAVIRGKIIAMSSYEEKKKSQNKNLKY